MQTNLKRSLGTAINAASTTFTLRLPKRTDMITNSTIIPNHLNIDEMNLHELRTQLHISQRELQISQRDVNELRAQLQEARIVQTQIQQLTQISERIGQIEFPSVVNNNTTNNVVNITLNDFGSEDVSYLESPDKYLRMRKDGLVLVIEHLHFHKDHPANRNVRLKSLKHQQAEVHVGGDWKVASLRATEDTMINRAHAYIARGIDSRTVTDETLQWMRDARTKDVKSHVREGVKSLLCTKRAETRSLGLS